MIVIFLIALATAIIIGGILYYVNDWLAKKNGEVISKRYIYSIGALILVYAILFTVIFLNYNHEKQVFAMKVTKLKAEEKRLKEEQKAEIDKIKADYSKEIAFLEWKNKVFTSSSEMNKSLNQAKTDYQLSDQEVKNWRSIAENNTLEKLIPKRDTKDVLKEYQTRLKGSLADIKAGQELTTSDIRMLSDNINAIRFVGKEYEKVLGSFKELYNSMIAGNDSEPVMPKQQKFLFFPVKTKEYNQLVQQYYEARGNQKATAEIAVKLKETIEKSEEEFKRINKKFEDNLGFLDANAESININSQKLQRLIESAISEAEIINDSDKSTTNIKINNNKKN